jgi:glycosyltransferase involved in cell wall biosynthesis
LIKEIRRFKPQVIRTHTARAGFLGRIASVLSLHSSVRVHTFHGHLLNGYFGGIKRSLVVLAEKLLAIFTDQLLAVGKKVRHDLLQAGVGSENRFGLMPPGLSIGPLLPRKESCDSLGLLSSQLQCAFIGRITQIKRPDRFLDLVAEVKRRKIEMNFFIAGDGELMGSLRKRIASENLPVTILGWQSDIEKVLSAADIVVLTSDNEGTPLSLIQAGMCALPVVTTNVGSVPDVVLDGVTGLVTSMDIQEIADALEKLVGDASLRKQYGIAAQEFTTSHFGVKRLVRDHEELYKNLLSSPANS